MTTWHQTPRHAVASPPRFSAEAPNVQPHPAAVEWPEGMRARYLTLAGAALGDPALTVDVLEAADCAVCRGCGLECYAVTAGELDRQAQDHAERCRALRRPQPEAPDPTAMHEMHWEWEF